MRCIFNYLCFFMMAVSGATARAEQVPGIPLAERPSLVCAYHFLKSQPAVQSAGIYAVDGFRSAVEYRFRTPDGHVLSSNILIMGGAMVSGPFKGQTLISYLLQDTDSQKVKDEQTNFFLGISDKLFSACQLIGAFDNVFPQPPSPRHWREVDISNWKSTDR